MDRDTDWCWLCQGSHQWQEGQARIYNKTGNFQEIWHFPQGNPHALFHSREFGLALNLSLSCHRTAIAMSKRTWLLWRYYFSVAGRHLETGSDWSSFITLSFVITTSFKFAGREESNFAAREELMEDIRRFKFQRHQAMMAWCWPSAKTYWMLSLEAARQAMFVQVPPGLLLQMQGPSQNLHREKVQAAWLSLHAWRAQSCIGKIEETYIQINHCHLPRWNYCSQPAGDKQSFKEC